MRAKSKTNSHHKTNLTLRPKYAKQHQECEFATWLPLEECGAWGTRASETHHIVGGTGGRYDLLSNLIRLSVVAHRFCTDNPVDGKVLCIWIKVQKNQFDPIEFKTCAGKTIDGWLSINRPSHAFVLPFYEELLKAFQ